jgi:hypothetical protein
MQGSGRRPALSHPATPDARLRLAHLRLQPPPRSPAAGHLSHSPQAFRFGARAWGLQFHLEADEGIIRGWITRYEDQLRAACIDPGSLARETSQRADLHRRQAVAFGRAFASVVERTATYA